MKLTTGVRDTKRLSAISALIITLWSSAAQPGDMNQLHDASPLMIEAKIPLGAVTGRIDHMALDIQRQRLFVAELGNEAVGVVSLPERKVTHTIGGLKEPQGVGYVPSADTLYVANAGNGSVGLYDGTSYTLRESVGLNEDADNIRVDANTNQVFIGYGSGAIAVIDIWTRRRVLDIALKGHPESFQLARDGQRIFINVPTNREVAVVDRAARKQVGQWNLRYQGNFPMALDEQNQRVLVGFRSPPRLAAYSMQDGAPLASVEICGDTDDVFFDARRGRVYVSCGEGLIDVLELRDRGYDRVARIPTSPGSRTALFNLEQDRLFLAVRETPVEPAAIWIFRPSP